MAKIIKKFKRSKRARKFVKDKAIVNFLLEHMKPAKINFSKFKIPSFIDFLKNEEKDSSNSKEFSQNQNRNKFGTLENSPTNLFFADYKK